MPDVFGYTRTSRGPGTVSSSEFAAIVLGGGQVSLAQAFDANMRQQVRPVYELGSSAVRWNIGYQEGQANLSRLAGGANFFEAFKAGDCGIISGLSLSVNGNRPCVSPLPSRGNLSFSDGVIESLGLRMTVGTSEITESASMRFSGMSTN